MSKKGVIVFPICMNRCGLNPSQFYIYSALCSYANGKTGKAWPKRTQLAQWTGISARSITRITSQLVALGWLEKDGSGGCSRSSLYRVTYPKNLVMGDMVTPQNHDMGDMVTPQNHDTGDMVTPQNHDTGDMVTPQNLVTSDHVSPQNLVTSDHVSPQNLVTSDHVSPQNLVTSDHPNLVTGDQGNKLTSNHNLNQYKIDYDYRFPELLKSYHEACSAGEKFNQKILSKNIIKKVELMFEAHPLDWWIKTFVKANDSDYISGRVDGGNGHRFKLRFSTFFNLETAEGISSGKYDGFNKGEESRPWLRQGNGRVKLDRNPSTKWENEESANA